MYQRRIVQRVIPTGAGDRLRQVSPAPLGMPAFLAGLLHCVQGFEQKEDCKGCARRAADGKRPIIKESAQMRACAGATATVRLQRGVCFRDGMQKGSPKTGRREIACAERACLGRAREKKEKKTARRWTVLRAACLSRAGRGNQSAGVSTLRRLSLTAGPAFPTCLAASPLSIPADWRPRPAPTGGEDQPAFPVMLPPEADFGLPSDFRTGGRRLRMSRIDLRLPVPDGSLRTRAGTGIGCDARSA